ncbi:MAG: glycosyltransferase family 2 protein, partial [Burkholderiales bacterium]|nr:glycosyltransferase family 2 protein [Opitutaceae bacterium]
MTSPVIYIFFNRPELTRRTFAAVREQRPSRLYLIADGPRPGHATDAVRCAETRAIIDELLDWNCEVTRDYSAKNLGCGRRLSSGLTAAFALLGEAIVLEDDILPHPDFFAFCDAQLAAHRHDPHIHAIS